MLFLSIISACLQAQIIDKIALEEKLNTATKSSVENFMDKKKFNHEINVDFEDEFTSSITEMVKREEKIFSFLRLYQGDISQEEEINIFYYSNGDIRSIRYSFMEEDCLIVEKYISFFQNTGKKEIYFTVDSTLPNLVDAIYDNNLAIVSNSLFRELETANDGEKRIYESIFQQTSGDGDSIRKTEKRTLKLKTQKILFKEIIIEKLKNYKYILEKNIKYKINNTSRKLHLVNIRVDSNGMHQEAGVEYGKYFYERSSREKKQERTTLSESKFKIILKKLTNIKVQ